MCRMPTQVQLSITKKKAQGSSSICQVNGYFMHQICTTHKGDKLNKKAKVYVTQLSLSRQYLYWNKEEWHFVYHVILT